MGNLVSKVAAGCHYIFIQKIFGLLRFIIWYIQLSIPYRLSKWALYILFRQLYIRWRSLWWLLRGVTYRKWRSSNPKNYERSAHVQNIIYRYKVDPVLEPSEQYNFMTTHARFEHPEYVLRDEVSLYFITAKEAFFIETDPDVDVTLSDASSFMRLAQFNNAKRLISMPVESFHRIAQLVGPVPGKLVFVNNTTRCGSTVLVQMFEKTGHCRSMSEPDALNAISFLSRRLPEEVTLQILDSVVKVLCKPYQGRVYESYVLKTTAPGIWSTHLMEKQFPEAKKIFMYRDGVKVANSLSKACIEMPILRATYHVSTHLGLFPNIQWHFTEYFCNWPEHPRKAFPSLYACCFFTWGRVLYNYIRYRQQGVDIVGVKYEHLVAAPKENMERVLNHCGLPTDWAEPALAALACDSQRNSPLNMKQLSRLSTFGTVYDERKHKSQLELMCDWCHLPHEALADWTAEGTITMEADGATPS